MDNKKNGIPKLRFPGFTGAWEQRKLGEITSVITKGTTPLDKSGKGSINFIKVEDLSLDNSCINVHSMISKEEHEGRLKRSILKEDDILFSIAGTLGRIGIVKSEILPANTNQALAIVRLKEGNLSYISTVLEGQTVKEYIRQNPTVGAQPNLSLKQVSELKISFPTLQEQEEVGNFFNKLNSLIALHQRKLEHLKEQKKGLLQKMFPKNGEVVPEVRFPGFTDDWEQRKLGEIIELYGGNAFSSKDSTTDGIPWLKISNVSTNGIDWEIKSFLPTNYWKKYPEYQLKNGDYVMALTRPVLNHALKIGRVDRPSLLNQRVAKLKFKFNREFTFQLLRRQQVVLRIENELAGTDPPNLGSRNLIQVNITLPINIHEQQKIGEYFSKFDTLIALHQRKLEHLKLMKKGLLQQMFV